MTAPLEGRPDVLEAAGRSVCRIRNQYAAELLELNQLNHPAWMLKWEFLTPEQQELDTRTALELVKAGREGALREVRRTGYGEMQHILAALLYQAGREGILITAQTLTGMPSAGHIREMDTLEGKRLWLDQSPSQ